MKRAPADVTMSAASIGRSELAAVARVLRSGRLSMGNATLEFERRGAEVAGTKHAVAVSSGTAGLHIAVRALGIGRDDIVVTPSFSFAASTNCFLYEGAEPAFADIDPTSFNVDPASVRQVIGDLRARGKRAKAILPVHVFGRTCEMIELTKIARSEDLVVIEDACEAVGATYRGQPAGSLGRAGVFAFYPNKQMTTGEGGMLVTDDDVVAAQARSLRNQGRGERGEWLMHVRLGYNYRITEMAAALGVEQFKRLPALLKARARVAAWYSAALREVSGVHVPDSGGAAGISWFVYVIMLDRSLLRDRVATELGRRGVETRPYFLPIHTQPYIRERFGDLQGSLPVTEDVGRRTLALPFHAGLTRRGVEFVVDALRAVLAGS